MFNRDAVGRMCKKKRIEKKMEVGWIIVIGVFGMLAVIGKCGELYEFPPRLASSPRRQYYNKFIII